MWNVNRLFFPCPDLDRQTFGGWIRAQLLHPFEGLQQNTKITAKYNIILNEETRLQHRYLIEPRKLRRITRYPYSSKPRRLENNSCKYLWQINGHYLSIWVYTSIISFYNLCFVFRLKKVLTLVSILVSMSDIWVFGLTWVRLEIVIRVNTI